MQKLSPQYRNYLCSTEMLSALRKLSPHCRNSLRSTEVISAELSPQTGWPCFGKCPSCVAGSKALQSEFQIFEQGMCSETWAGQTRHLALRGMRGERGAGQTLVWYAFFVSWRAFSVPLRGRNGVGGTHSWYAFSGLACLFRATVPVGHRRKVAFRK